MGKLSLASIVPAQPAAAFAKPAAFLAALIALGALLAWLPLAAAAALIGALAAVVILLHPVWGLAALIPVIPFSSLVSVQAGSLGVGGMEALLGLILVAWLLRMAARRHIAIPHPPLLIPWLVWLGAILASWVVALSLGAALSESVKWVEMLAVYLFVVANVERRHLPWLAGALLLAGAAQAALGLYQFLFRIGPEGFLLFDGRFLRAYGTFRQPNPYAGYLGLVLPLAYSLAAWGLVSRRRHPAQATTLGLAVALSAFGLMLAALFASQSRGAWLAFVAALAAASLARGGRTTALFLLLIAALALAGAFGAFQSLLPVIAQRLGDALSTLSIPDLATVEVTDANFAAVERMAHWRAALDMWRDHLWLGVGFGNYPAVYPAYAVGRWLDPLGHAHNYYLNVAAETGLVGLLAYILFWASAFVLGWRAARRSTGWEQALAAGALGVLVHLSVHNGVDNLFVQGMYLHVSVILGILCLLAQTKVDNLDHPY